MSMTAKGENTVPQCHVLFKIFCIYNYISIFIIFVLKDCRGIKDCVKFNFSQNYHRWSVIFLTNNLLIFPAVMNYRNFQAVVLIFSLYWWSKGNTHTYKGPSDKTLFLHKIPSGITTPHSPPLIHQDATEKYQFSNYNGNIYL